MKKIKNFINVIFNTLAECIVPTIPVIVGAGMLKVALIIVGPEVLAILDTASDTYICLTFISDAAYYFVPVFVAIASGEYFKTNKYVAGMMGAMLLSPVFTGYVTSGTPITLFGLPIYLTSYGAQVISPVIIVFIESKLYNFLDKIFPEKLRTLFVPLLTIVIMAPIAFCAIGPLGVILGNYLVDIIYFLKDLGPIGNGILCALLPFVVILGLGSACLSSSILIAATGVDPIMFFSNVLYNNILGASVLAVYLKNKKPDYLAAGITAAVGGVSEPSVFGVVLKNKIMLLPICAACFVAGTFSGIFGIKTFAMASFGLFGMVTTIGPGSSFPLAVVCLLIGYVVSFVLTFVVYKNKEN